MKKKSSLLLIMLFFIFNSYSQTNEEKALALIAAFESGDQAALDYVSDDTYINHNLSVPSGKGVLSSFITGTPSGITTNAFRSFELNDIVVTHSIYGGVWNGGIPQVAFDVFRFENGLIVEHWDNLSAVVDDMDGTSQTDGALTPVSDLASTDANQALLEEMAQVLFVEGDWTNLRDYFDLDAYIQHSVGSGPDGAFLETLEGATNLPFYDDVKFVYTLGNFGLVMSQGPDITGNDPDGTYAYYDLFRMDNGRIVEHWDVIQLIPNSDQWANSNGKWGDDNIFTNEEKALALISAFETGNTQALDYVSDDTYINHNLSVPSGKGVLSSFINGTPSGITTNAFRSFELNDIVVTHSIYGGVWNGGIPQVAFDVFRFENGLIVEHWDNLSAVVDDMDGTSQTDGALTPASDLASTDANQALLEEMAQVLFVEGDWTNLRDYFDLDAYIQHSVGSGPDGAFLETLEGATNLPFYDDVKFVYTLGNFGLVMSQGPDITGNDPDGTYAYYDLFRMDNGRIVEHWDVIQLIPNSDQWANSNGKWGDDNIFTNEEKALALISAFETGNTQALDYVSDDTYINHNLSVPSGKGVLSSFINGTPSGITTNAFRSFELNDIVVTHSIYGGVWNGGIPQVAFDVFRFENGLIVEHWDNLSAVVDDMDGTSQTDGALTPASDLANTDANQALLEEMAQVLFVEGDWTNLRDYFDLDAYIQHSVGSGPDGAFLETLEGATNLPFYDDVKFVYTLGNFGLVMSQGPDITGNDPDGTYAYYDLFRMDNGRIVEHWDVIQLIPTPDQWANNNGKWGDDAIFTGVDLNLNLAVENQLYDQYTTVDYIFTLTNEGDATATNIEVAAGLPDGMVYTSSSTNNGNYSLYFEKWTVDELAPGETAVLDLTLFTLIEDEDIIYFTQVLSLDQQDADSEPNNSNGDVVEDDEASVTIFPKGDGGFGTGEGNNDLELSISADSDTYDTYEGVLYTISVTNNGAEPATGIEVSAGLPDGMVYSGSSTDDGDYNLYYETWTIDFLEAGQTAVLELDFFTLVENQPITNFVQIFVANEQDPDSTPGNNTTGIPAEDDEASVTIEYAENFSGMISQSGTEVNIMDGLVVTSDNQLPIPKNDWDNAVHKQNELTNSIQISLAPNPFINTTNFEFQIIDEGNFLFQVFDITGKEVSAQKLELIKGTNRLTYNGSQLTKAFIAIG